MCYNLVWWFNVIKFISESTEKTEKIGFELAQSLKYGTVVAMFGDLGAGKTAFTRGFAKGMGLNADVSSPTFALVNEYRNGKKVLYHFDMYRITSWDDLYSTGYFEFLDEGASMIIEWSENIENVLPDDSVKIHINKTEKDNERIIEIYGCDDLEITGI